MLALALPAFEATRSDWRTQGRLSRHLPRPLRQRDRQARHQPARRGAARRDARPSDQGGARHRGPALLRPFRHRRLRHVPRAGREPARQRRRPGRLVDLPAARQEPLPLQRAHHRAQDQGSVPRALARGQPLRRTRSSSSISTAPTWAAARSAWRRRPNSTSASRSRTSTSPRRRCSPACSRRRRATRRTSTCRRRARAPTRC